MPDISPSGLNHWSAHPESTKTVCEAAPSRCSNAVSCRAKIGPPVYRPFARVQLILKPRESVLSDTHKLSARFSDFQSRSDDHKLKDSRSALQCGAKSRHGCFQTAFRKLKSRR